MSEQAASEADQTESGPALTATDGSPLPYAAALAELEEILAELDAGSADVDRLADRVERAADLVRYCRHRLGVVRADVDDVVGDLDPSERSGSNA